MFSAGHPTQKTGGKEKIFARNDKKGGERSVRRWPNSTIYCWSCGFDLKEDHHTKVAGGCRWKKYGHKDDATIENRMGGSTRNCFHHPNWETLKNNWRRWKEGEKYKRFSNNNNSKKEVVPYILPSCKENLAKIVKCNDDYNSVRKQLLTIIEEPEQTKETIGKLDSAASSHFINKNCPGKTIQHVPMTVG